MSILPAKILFITQTLNKSLQSKHQLKVLFSKLLTVNLQFYRMLALVQDTGAKMLKELSIRNFAIIDDLQIDFSGGLTILSGETGAGKSIILNAVNLLLGSRASAELVRTGAESADFFVPLRMLCPSILVFLV